MSESKQANEYLTLREVAIRWGCSHSSVLNLVYRGDLRAIDISSNPTKQSRYVKNDACLRFSKVGKKVCTRESVLALAGSSVPNAKTEAEVISARRSTAENC